MKNIKRHHIKSIHIWDLFDGRSPNEVSDTILKLIEGRTEKYDSFEFEAEEEYNHISVHLYGLRLETDEEYSFRLNRDRELEERIKIKELDELKRLKEKYESSKD